MAEQDMSGVSLTAHYTAYAWHLLGVPEAHRFITRRGRWLHRVAKIFEIFTRPAGIGDLVSILMEPRHLLFEHLIKASKSRCIVELGAGLSPRGTAYTRDSDLTYIEVDLPRMSALKARLVGEAKGENQHFLAGNVLDPGLFDRLEQLIRNKGPVAVVAEGLLYYLKRKPLEQMLEDTARLLKQAGGGVFISDLNPVTAIERFGLAGWLFIKVLARVARWPATMSIRDSQEARELFLNAGFDEIQGHDPRTHPAAARLEHVQTRGVVLLIEASVKAG